SSGLGGAIRVVTGTAIIQNSLIENNQSDEGGGIASQGALTLINTRVLSNTSRVTNGGGLEVGGTAVISHSQILSNTVQVFATYEGGGGLAILAGAQVSISDSQISANHALTATDSFGGGILDLGVLTITHSSLN